MQHAVLGAGGVGGLVGGALAKAGHEVTLLVRPGRRDQYSERLTVESETLGSFKAPVRVADRFDGRFDIVWITVKATALEVALRTVPPEKLGDGVVVPLLNGVDHVEQLRKRYGAERVLPGTIQVEAEQIGPGQVRHLSAFAKVQVAPRPATQARAEALCEELRVAGLGCDVREDEVTILWNKLCFLAPLALATTASGGSLGVVRSDPGWWTRLERCVKEACTVALAEGAKVAPEPILATLEGAPNGFRSSMQKDVAAGRPPEVEAIAGPILRCGNEHGIDVSATRALVDQIMKLE
ncbi:MAG: 2-dehydropantoate 2-reductase [Actinomycetota bacterium]|nr:2-dehydropantoate 2-reductase [Actinomycetota bacterium]